ncbi:heat shock 70 kDa protein 13 [Lethenteron reissneri]|uniref:heat shock 70 kDa protein 13 n=1 Tax=Lethenteron reissneri TaxID=7753 RepID=UPI002AB69B38|nr:heat shock 70 kDa protein 13 [Lethenteron reissneri]
MAGEYTMLGMAVLALLLAGYLGQQYLPPPKPRIVGIDLGTTYCSIGVYHAGVGEVEVLADADGRRAFPSVVAAGPDGHVLAGFPALQQAADNPHATLYDAKRFIGRAFSPGELEREAGRYQFTVRQVSGEVVFVLRGHGGAEQTVTPEWVGAQMLDQLRLLAEERLGLPVRYAVLAVPAEFDERQRNSTIKAATMAGLEVLRVVNEPTAAALAYGLHEEESVSSVLVVDLGGGTTDVSLLTKQGGMFFTRAMAGNNHLGGQDFTQRLVEHLTGRLADRHGGGRPWGRADTQLLREAAEMAKLELTHNDRARVSLRLSLAFTPDNGTHHTVEMDETVTRQEFESLNEDLFQKVMEPIVEVLRSGRLVAKQVDRVVLVGGSTRIPRVRRMLADYFGSEPDTRVDPELAVVTGVAVQAGVLAGAWPLRVGALDIPNKHLRKVTVT